MNRMKDKPSSFDEIFEMGEGSEPESLVDASDVLYHNQSMVLAKMFREAYTTLGTKHELTSSLREAYIATRRQINTDESGNRFGHAEAYAALRK